MLKKVHRLHLTSARTRDHSPSNAFNTRTYVNAVEKVARAHLGKLYTLTRRRTTNNWERKMKYCGIPRKYKIID